MVGAAPVAMASPADPARVIVKLRPSVLLTAQSSAVGQNAATEAEVSRRRIKTLGQRLGVSLDGSRALTPRMHLARAAGLSSLELARRLSAQSDVEFAVVDERRYVSAGGVTAPNDAFFGPQSPPNGGTLRAPQAGQWYLQTPGNNTPVTPASINAPGAWAITGGSRAVVVAVLDTGIRYDHADLQGKLLPGYNMISVPLIAGNQVGRTNNPSDLGDFITQADVDQANQIRPGFFDSCPLAAHARSTWHGTQVAGLIGASTHNNLGMAGLGQEVQILPVRVLGKCGGYDSDILDGMRWAAGLAVDGAPRNPFPAKVINLSLGSGGACSAAYSSVIGDLVAMNVLVVAAAGNSEGRAVQAPGNCPGVVAVTSLNHDGNKSQTASAGSGSDVFIAAPGGDCSAPSGPCDYPLLTTFNTGMTVPQANGSTYTDAYLASVGTSFAAPLVSGTAALMWSVNPALNVSDIKGFLSSSARPFVQTGAAQCNLASSSPQGTCQCTQPTCGAGMLDAGGAVVAATTAATTPVAVISVGPAAPVVGQVLTLSSLGSRPRAGASIIDTQWTVIETGGIVSATLGGTAQSPTLIPTGKGLFKVRLSVTDSLNQVNQVNQVDLTIPVEQTVSITEGPFVAKSSAGGGGGGGGGGADDVLLGLLLLASAHTAWAWLTWFNPRRRRASRAA